MDYPFDIHHAMDLAINEARRGAGFVAPNPMVGCLVYDKDGKELARGFHALFGGAHAEVDAISKIEDKSLLEGAHVVVTLEPCAHEGKTPSCAKMLAEYPLATVTYGLKDPNDLVDGKGSKILNKAGIKAVPYEGDTQKLEELIEHFLMCHREQRAFFALKVATSLDGQMALEDGSSKWITSEQSRSLAHHLRATHDGIMVGRKTFELDNPSLNVRHDEFPESRNKVVLLDPRAKLKNLISSSSLSKSHSPEEIFLVTSDPVESKDFKNIVCPLDEHGDFNLKELGRLLYENKIYSVLVEGGSVVHSFFLAQGIWDRIHLFIAPKIFGSAKSISWSQGFSISELAEAYQLEWTRTVTVGPDIYFTGRNFPGKQETEAPKSK